MENNFQSQKYGWRRDMRLIYQGKPEFQLKFHGTGLLPLTVMRWGPGEVVDNIHILAQRQY